MSTDPSKPSLSYKDAGVDIDAGNSLVERISGVAKRTRRPEVMAGLGGFGALCELPSGYREPVLVSGTDGVGTKLMLAMEMKSTGMYLSRGLSFKETEVRAVSGVCVCHPQPNFATHVKSAG